MRTLFLSQHLDLLLSPPSPHSPSSPHTLLFVPFALYLVSFSLLPPSPPLHFSSLVSPQIDSPHPSTSSSPLCLFIILSSLHTRTLTTFPFSPLASPRPSYLFLFLPFFLTDLLSPPSSLPLPLFLFHLIHFISSFCCFRLPSLSFLLLPFVPLRQV